MDEPQRRRLVRRFQEGDAVALARAVPQIEMIGMSRPQLCRTPVPVRDDLGASGDGRAIVETAIERLLAQAATIRRLQRRGHIASPEFGLTFPPCRKMFYKVTQSSTADLTF